jgi:hypothetical protein
MSFYSLEIEARNLRSREDCVSSVSISIGAQLSVPATFACRLPLETDPAVLDFLGRLGWGLLMKLNAMKKISMMVVGAGALVLGSSAGADGLSGELTIPVNRFSIGAAINYTYELVPNWFVGGSLEAAYTPSLTADPFSAGARLGTNYIINLAETRDLKADTYIGAAMDMNLIGGFSATPELNAGARATFSVTPAVKLFGGADGKLALNFVPAGVSVAPSIFGYFGGKLEPITNLEAYAQAGIGYANAFNYDLKFGMYYTVIPEVRLGASVGYNGDFRATFGAQFAQKPGTLATPGNFLP